MVRPFTLEVSLIPRIRAGSPSLASYGINSDTLPHEITLTHQQVISTTANIASRASRIDHSRSGFIVDISAEQIDTIGNVPRDDIDWIIRFRLRSEAFTWETTSVRIAGGSSFARLGSGAITTEGFRYDLDRVGAEMSVTVRRCDFQVVQCEIAGSVLSIEFEALPLDSDAVSAEGLELILTHAGVTLTHGSAENDEKGRWKATVVLPDLAPVMSSNYLGFTVEVHASNGHLADLEISALLHRKTSSGNYGLSVSRRGLLKVERYAQFGEALSAELLEDGATLRIRGSIRFDGGQVRQRTPSLMMWSKGHTIFPGLSSFDSATGDFSVDFLLLAGKTGGAAVAPPHGNYLLGLMLATGQKLPSSFTMLAGGRLLAALPQELQSERVRVTLKMRQSDGGLVIAISNPFAEDERGAFAQAKLGARFSFHSRPQVQEAVLFESFGGRAIADSPRALAEQFLRLAPEMTQYWTVRESSTQVPDGAVPVMMYSRKWYDVLASSRYLMNNNNFPHFFRKQRDQKYIQTWHGTPLKKIGNDVPDENLSLVYRRLMQREAECWDLLLAQSPWAGEILASAFGYSGPIFDEGYPRNDALNDNHVSARRAHMRSALGLAKHQQVVLYAPTWRDNLKGAQGNYLRPSYLDTKVMHRAFGRDTIVLMRGHANTHADRTPVSGPNVLNVSNYPDINDLFLAADVLITDYSSVQFDFVNTGRPILYLAPDLATYRDSVRGFYFDFPSVAPGPIVQSTDEVVEELRNIREYQARFGQRYRSFTTRFAPRDDGYASRRAAEHILGVTS